MKYYLFEIRYFHGEFEYLEHYVIRADEECEAENRIQDGLSTWYGTALEQDETGLYDNTDNEYEGGILYEVTKDFVDQIPQTMKLFDFGRK